MEKLDVISVPFYKFKCSDELAQKIFEEVKTLSFEHEANTTNGCVYLNYYNADLFDFFNQSITEFKKLYFHDNVEFPIVDCWVNKYTTMNKLSKHTHSNSIICGIYYVTDHENHGSTVFEYKNPWIFSNIESDLYLSLNKENKPLQGEIFPEMGSLILFPPSLAHYMKTLSTKTIRYTIAFNTFASGVVSTKPSGSLTLKTTSLVEKLNMGKNL